MSSIPLQATNQSDSGSTAKLAIFDVRLAGKSIQGAHAPASIQTTYTGKSIELEVLGRFSGATPPKVAAVLNNGLDLEVLAANSSRILLRLDTAGIVDLYLAGPHTLRIRVDSQVLQTTILVGSPEELLIPFPEIVALSPDYGSGGALTSLEVTGSYFPRNPYFASAQIDGNKITIQAVRRQGSQDHMVLKLPSSLQLDEGQTHTLVYATPFGSLQHTFQLSP